MLFIAAASLLTSALSSGAFAAPSPSWLNINGLQQGYSFLKGLTKTPDAQPAYPCRMWLCLEGEDCYCKHDVHADCQVWVCPIDGNAPCKCEKQGKLGGDLVAHPTAPCFKWRCGRNGECECLANSALTRPEDSHLNPQCSHLVCPIDGPCFCAGRPGGGDGDEMKREGNHDSRHCRLWKCPEDMDGLCHCAGDPSVTKHQAILINKKCPNWICPVFGDCYCEWPEQETKHEATQPEKILPPRCPIWTCPFEGECWCESSKEATEYGGGYETL